MYELGVKINKNCTIIPDPLVSEKLYLNYLGQINCYNWSKTFFKKTTDFLLFFRSQILRRKPRNRACTCSSKWVTGQKFYCKDQNQNEK